MRPVSPRPQSATLAAASALVLAFVGACGSSPSDEASATRNVFGADERVTAPDAAPYRAVGRFDVGCTGTLIGRRLVLTAAHCIVDSTTGAVKKDMSFFRPDFRTGRANEALWAERFWLGSEKPESERLKDWAIVRLEKAPAQAYGAMPVQGVALTAALPLAASVIGYSADRENGDVPSLIDGCHVQEIVEGKLFHDCDATAGVSGGPLLKQVNGVWSVIGVTVSEYRQGAVDSVHRDVYTKDYANVAVPAEQFQAALRTLLQTVDGDGAAPAIAGVVEKANPNVRPVDGTGGGVDATKVRPLADLQSGAIALQHLTSDLVLASQQLVDLVNASGPAELHGAAAQLLAAARTLQSTTGLAINAQLGTAYAGRVFGDYHAAQLAVTPVATYHGPQSAAGDRLATLAQRAGWLVGRYESLVFSGP